jgi:hypothetical protein
MAHYFVNADKDATILRGADIESTSSVRNTGLDEILEVGKKFQVDSSAIGTISRALISFPITAISESISDGTIGSDASYYLNLYDAGSVELQRSQSLYTYAVSQSWTEGSGRQSDNPQTEDGVSWRYRTEATESIEWDSSSTLWGATYFSGSGYSGSQSFNKDDQTDMRMNVTDIVNNWLVGSASNEGFLIKRTDTEETSDTRYGIFKFFSSDTHTIFPPKLEVVWDDATWTTGSLSALSVDELGKVHLYMSSFRQEYKQGSLTKIRVYGRERFPTRTFSTSSVFLDVNYLPSASSFYSIVDSKTTDVIVPFGSGSKLSCDSTGNFFKLRTGTLQPERFYKVVFKVVSGSGVNETIEYYDEDYTFKVTR